MTVPPIAVLDTNILLLLLVGETHTQLIPRVRRLSRYSIAAYSALKRSLARVRKLVITPHALAELSNLSFKDLAAETRGAYLDVFRRVLSGFAEDAIDKDTILKHPLLEKVGVTDVSLAQAGAKPDTVVVTDDFRAAGLLQKQGCVVWNTNWMLGQMYLDDE